MPKVHGGVSPILRARGETPSVIYDKNGNPRDIEDLKTLIVLAAGANRIGKVTVRNTANDADIDPLAEATFTARLGEVQDSPTANTMLARLKAIVTELDARIPASLSNPLQVELEQITAAALQKDSQTSAIVTCATANIDQVAPAQVPAFAKYLWAWCASAFKVAVDEATTSGIGIDIPANNPVLWPIKTVAGGDAYVHVQSSTTLALVYTGYVANA